jgi:hypothetical protein
VSKTVRTKPITPPAIRARKGGEPIVCLTSFTAPMARLVDPYVDLILVGDSLTMTVYGMASTVGVTPEMMIAHGRAVAQAASHACIVVDLPFGSYEDRRRRRSAPRPGGDSARAAPAENTHTRAAASRWRLWSSDRASTALKIMEAA